VENFNILPIFISQETKFVLIISKKWFHEFDSLDDCTINSDNGLQVSFKLGEEKVMVD